MNFLTYLRRAIPVDHPLRVLWHQLEGFMGALLYRFPSRKLRVIGVTGTDGKTTTSQMIAAILRAGGRKVGLSSTTHFQVGEERWENTTHRTTLGRLYMHKLLRRMVREGCDVAVLEVTSHALHQGRVNGVSFDTACITTISHEHLEYHRTPEEYVRAKQLLFKRLESSSRKKNISKVAVVNLDMPEWHTFANVKVDEVYGYTLHHMKDANVNEVVFASNIVATREHTSFELHIQQMTVEITLPMVGVFNVSNALAAASVCYTNGASLDVIKAALEKFAFREGRMERVDAGQPFDVYVDFAMSPGSYASVYTSLRQITPGRIIAVFGACGARDPQKWPKIGRVAAEMTDFIVVTDDEPYSDDPATLRGLVMTDFIDLHQVRGEDYVEIPDRREAIEYAMKEAKEGDAVIITGMGNFKYRVFDGKEVPWSDVAVAREAIEKLG